MLVTWVLVVTMTLTANGTFTQERNAGFTNEASCMSAGKAIQMRTKFGLVASFTCEQQTAAAQ